MATPIGDAKNSGTFSHRAEKKEGVIGRHKIALQPLLSEEEMELRRSTSKLAARTLSYSNLFAPSQEKLGKILRGRSISPRRARGGAEEYKTTELSERKSLSPSSRSVSPSPRSSSSVNTAFFLERLAAAVRNWRAGSPSQLIADIAAIEQENSSSAISEELRDKIAILLEQVRLRNFSLQEMASVKGIIKRLVEGGDVSETDPHRIELVSRAFSLLSQLPYEKAVLLVDEQLIMSFVHHDWCEVIDKDLPRTMVLVQVPAIKSLLALSAIQSFSFDTLSAYLGMHLLVSQYKQAPLEERQNFVEKLIQAHFTHGAPLEFNMRQSAFDEIRKTLDDLESNLELRLDDCIKNLARQTTVESDLYSAEKLHLSDADRQNLLKIEDIDGFYMHLLGQLASNEDQRAVFSEYFYL